MTPTVLLVCVHNAGRSQMAAGWLTALADDRVRVRSAGSEPAAEINAVAAEAMREVGIDITGAQPRLLTTDAVRQASPTRPANPSRWCVRSATRSRPGCKL